jgi:hypothetical protein
MVANRLELPEVLIVSETELRVAYRQMAAAASYITTVKAI